MTTHYSLAQKPSQLNEQAIVWAKALVEYCKQRSKKNKKIPILCYSGMSGIASATALSLELQRSFPKFQYAMAYVRKENEKSHGESVEHSIFEFIKEEIDEHFLPVFVDDFVSGGGTRGYTMSKVYDYFCKVRRYEFGDFKQKMEDTSSARFVLTIQFNYDPKTRFYSFQHQIESRIS